jgi:hypothetical protein
MEPVVQDKANLLRGHGRPSPGPEALTLPPAGRSKGPIVQDGPNLHQRQARQTKPIPSADRRSQVLAGKQVMVDWSYNGPRRNKANSPGRRAKQTQFPGGARWDQPGGPGSNGEASPVTGAKHAKQTQFPAVGRASGADCAKQSQFSRRTCETNLIPRGRAEAMDGKYAQMPATPFAGRNCHLSLIPSAGACNLQVLVWGPGPVDATLT